VKARRGREVSGPYGTAVEVIIDEHDTPDQTATVAAWFVNAPGQSPAWASYVLGVIHLRPIEGVRPADVRLPGATHEVLLYACEPAHGGRAAPVAADPGTWRPMRPLNAVEQVELPDDDAAVELARLCALAIVHGDLPAEPALSGAREPWHTSMIRTSAHLRGEPHAP
jgi:hypothetical protein